MNSSFPGVSRDTDQGVVWIGGELWIACDGTGVSMGGRAHSSLFFCSATKESTTCTQVLCECLEMCTTGNRSSS